MPCRLSSTRFRSSPSVYDQVADDMQPPPPPNSPPNQPGNPVVPGVPNSIEMADPNLASGLSPTGRLSPTGQAPTGHSAPSPPYAGQPSPPVVPSQNASGRPTPLTSASLPQPAGSIQSVSADPASAASAPGAPQKRVPAWLAPFSTPQATVAIDPSRKLGVFAGLTAAIAIPLAYVGLFGLTVIGMWYHFTHHRHLLEANDTISTLSYYGPIVVGAMFLTLALLPFVMRRSKIEATYRIDTNENPSLLAFVEAVAAHVGAPSPSRISGSLENGIRVQKGANGGTEVILGLPLIAIQTARQTAGFLAHEFFKYSSQPSAKTWGITHSVQMLFAGAAYDCGEPECDVVDWGGSRRKPSNVMFGILPWAFERLVPLFADDIHENLVFDADRSQLRVAGSNTFAVTQLDRLLLDEIVAMSEEGFAAARQEGQKSQNLPLFYASKLRRLKSERPDFVKRVCKQLMEDSDGPRPTMADRIAFAQKHQEKGVFPVDAPSAGLFRDFTQVCRSTTALHYDRHFGSEIQRTAARLAAESNANAEAEAAALAAQEAQAQAMAQVEAERQAAAHAAQAAEAQRLADQRAAQQVQQAAQQQAAQQTQPQHAPPQHAPNTQLNVAPDAPQPSAASFVPTAAVPSAASVPHVEGAALDPCAAANEAEHSPPIAPRHVAPSHVAEANLAELPAGEPVATVGAKPSRAESSDAVVATEDVPVAVVLPSDKDRSYLSAFLQTDVLSNVYDLFLPSRALTAPKDPEKAVRTLQAARQRYEPLLIARKPELEQLATGTLYLRSLHMARTMSLVGLAIDAEALGLSAATNAAVVEACNLQNEQIATLRQQLQELRDQGTLRLVMSVQLAESKIVAQAVGLQPGEVEAARFAVRGLSSLKEFFPVIDDLAQQQRRLRCLMFNLEGNEDLEELTTCLSLTHDEICESIRRAYEVLPNLLPVAEALQVAVPTFADPIPMDSRNLVTLTSHLLTLYDSLYKQSFDVVACLGEKMENHFGYPPLEVPSPATLASARSTS